MKIPPRMIFKKNTWIGLLKMFSVWLSLCFCPRLWYMTPLPLATRRKLCMAKDHLSLPFYIRFSCCLLGPSRMSPKSQRTLRVTKSMSSPSSRPMEVSAASSTGKTGRGVDESCSEACSKIQHPWDGVHIANVFASSVQWAASMLLVLRSPLQLCQSPPRILQWDHLSLLLLYLPLNRGLLRSLVLPQLLLRLRSQGLPL